MILIILLIMNVIYGFHNPKIKLYKFISSVRKKSKSSDGNPFLRGIYEPVTSEINIDIKIPQSSIFKKLSGFFAQIGPNPKFHSVFKPYSLFDGDGMIHGIFNNSKITYTNHWVKTKKLQTEMKWNQPMYLSLGELKGISGLSSIFSSELMKTFKLVPSGYTANTAFMHIEDKLFALHETDTPYQIILDFRNKTIQTGKQYKFDDIRL